MPSRFPPAGWPLLVPAVWLLAALAAVQPGRLVGRSYVTYLVYDPADLGAFTVRAANAHAGRPPGRLDEPSPLYDPDRFAAKLVGPQPPLADRFYLEYPPPALGLFWLEAAVVGPAALPPAAADAEHTDVARHRPRTPAEREAWGRLGAAARVHLVLMAAALVALGVVLRGGPGLWLIALPGAGYFSLLRCDVLPALATAVAFRCVGRGRCGWAGAWLAVAVGLKLYPVLFLPVLVRLVGWKAGLRLVAGFAVTLALIVAASVLAVGVEGAVTPIRLQLNRVPELGNWVLYGRLLPESLAYSSAGRLGLLAAVVLACVVTRPADLPAALRRCGLVLLAFTQLAVFWSPQWLVWFLPLTVPLTALDRRTGWAAAAVDAANYLSFPVLFHLVWNELPVPVRQPTAEVLIAVRTLAWVWLGWRLLVGGRVRGGFDLPAVRAAVTPPRGLAWADIAAAGEPRVSAGRALVPVTVRFEPTPDGGLEDVPQAREPRQAVAVFVPRGGRWVPTGKLAFNLTAEELAGRLP